MPRVAALLAALGAMAASSCPALAATVTLEYEEPIPGIEDDPLYTLSVEAGAGEANAVSVSQDADGYTVRDTAVPAAAGAGCEPLAPDAVRCPASAAAAHSVFVAAGDGLDQVTVEAVPATTFVEARGGTGDDFVVGGPGRDLLFGGSGRDVIHAGPGNDRLDGGRGDDQLDGLAGIDRVLYDERRAPVTVDLRVGSGGGRGEADVIAGVEEILGGLATDDLAGDDGPNLIIGGRGGGRDEITGRGGNDHLSGHRVSGGPGDDLLGGDLVSCGAGHDLIVRGADHNPRGPFPRACEVVLAIFVTLEPDPVRRSSRWVEYAVACRAPRCTGALELRDRRGRLGRKRFALRHGDDPAALHRVRVPLTRRPVQRVATLSISGPRAYQRDWFRTRVRASRNQ